MHPFFPRILLFICVHTVFHSSCLARDDSLVADTSTGSLRGRLQNVIHGLSVRQFLGIPYAEPPVGELRFARPQPAKPWKGVREAIEFGPICPQMSLKEMFAAFQLKSNISVKEEPQSEDCLTLNVYTPSKASTNDKLAVMVWIHGGGYVIGSGSTYNPSILVAYHDVIVVTINYRIGVLGFFNIPGTDVKGNYGMHDQVLALKWVQQNIANFGGDSNKVTIFGESAGGMSVSHHLISPLSKGLFQRVIAQSGSSASPFTGVKVKSTKLVETFAKSLDCKVDQGLMDCLRSKSWPDVLNAQRNITFPVNVDEQSLSTVTVDGEFLPDKARTLLKEGKMNQADVMMGVTMNEGALRAVSALEVFKDGVDLKTVKNLIKNGKIIFENKNKLVEDATLFEYVEHGDLDNGIKNRQAVIDIHTDNVYLAPAVFEAKALVKSDLPVYFYVFDHQPHFSQFPRWAGAFHIVDVIFTMGVAVQSDNFGKLFKYLHSGGFSDLDVGLSLSTMKLWTNFAKHGDPNVGAPIPVTWPRYNSSGHVHLRISLEPKVEHSFRERKMAFWNEFVPKLAGDEPEQNGGEKTKKEKVKEEL